MPTRQRTKSNAKKTAPVTKESAPKNSRLAVSTDRVKAGGDPTQRNFTNGDR